MNKQKAIQAMREGKKVKHQFFSRDEWMTIVPNTNLIMLEDGVTIFLDDFFADRDGVGWDDGYEIL